MASYADLRGDYGANADAGARHFILYGAAEGRTASFNAHAYPSENRSVSFES